MDYLEQPEIKSKYEKCKYIVKLWEHNFKRDKGRLPSKLDIREADFEVRGAYRKYFQLKTAALEQSFSGIDGFNFDEDEAGQKSICDNVDDDSSAPEKNHSTTVASSDEPGQQSDTTWGFHLDKKVVEKIDVNSNKSSSNLINSSITKKLFVGSKFTKRNPLRSMSFTQKRANESQKTSTISLSQPVASSTTVFDDHAEISHDNNVRFVSLSREKVASQSLNIVQSVLDNNYRSLKSVDPGWLQRVVQHSSISIEQPNLIIQADSRAFPDDFLLNDDEEDIIYDSDDDAAAQHVAKKLKTANNVPPPMEINKKPVEYNFTNMFGSHSATAMVASQSASDKINEIINNNSSTKFNPENLFDTAQSSTHYVAESDKITAPPATTATTSSTLKQFSKDIYDFSTESLCLKQKSQRRMSIRSGSSNNRSSLKELSNSEDDDEDPFHSDNDSSDPEFTLNTTKRINKKNASLSQILDQEVESSSTSSSSAAATTTTTTTTLMMMKETKRTERKSNAPRRKSKENIKNISGSGKKKSKKKEKEAEVETTTTEYQQTYELEYSIKPRVSVPRYRNLSKLIDNNNIDQQNESDEAAPSSLLPEVKDKRQQEKDKFQQKIESGNLNENFVRINIKKKVYSRGKKNMNFSKYKKQQWKNKKKALAGPDMDMGGCDGGMLTCFNCGDIGHFARNCKKAKGDNLLPLNNVQGDEVEEACPYPTLEEAAQMAKESVLAVRKPTKLTTDDVKEANEDAENDNHDDEEEDVDDCDFDDRDTDRLLAEALKLEEHVARLDLRMYLDDLKTVEPYYQLREDGSIIDTPLEVTAALHKFGHNSFRPGQEQAIMRILSGKSTLVTLSTGSGKSLCYQIPAYLYAQDQKCISLIISPLVSLMEDQVSGIPSFLKAACLHTNQTKVQREKIMEAIAAGDLSVLLVSPEAVVAGEKSSAFGSLLRKLPPIAFACIDEAHCVSQWSHNFRPSYLMICRVLRERMGVRTVLGLTATATRATKDSIVNHLQISDGINGIISDIPLPDNLVLSVSKDYQRDNALMGLLTSERFANCRSIIVYCTRREECERIAGYLRTSLKDNGMQQQSSTMDNSKKRKRNVSVQAEPYHAGLSASRRRTIQKTFMSGELRIVVATVAFGMGINKSDIRSVIHYNMPKNFESYVQEIGRAGRDGLPAYCHMFLDSQGRDENELRRHIYANSIDRHVIRKLLQKVFVQCSCKAHHCPRHEVAFSIEETVRQLDIPEENISTLLCYLELHQNKYIELLSPAYTTCKVLSYGGSLEIRKAAKECPPLAMALALNNNNKSDKKDLNALEFPVVEIASAMGWDSGICKHKLKNLEWTSANGVPKRSCLNIQFSNLGYRLLAPGNLDDDQLDEALDSLYEHVVNQEEMALLQLRAVHQTLIEAAAKSYKLCLPPATDNTDDDEQERIAGALKLNIRRYFDSVNPLESISLGQRNIIDEQQLISDINGLINMYRDNTFTGRAIARIFHGIMSPNYPAVIWGRCKFWRSHINVDFNTICKIATKQILRLK